MLLQIDKNIKYYRQKSNLTQDEFAKKLNVNRSTVAQWEVGNNTPDIYTLIKICEILQVSLISLIGEDETDKYYPIIQEYNNNRIIERFGSSDRVKFLQHQLDLLTESELDDIEFALEILNKRRGRS